MRCAADDLTQARLSLILYAGLILMGSYLERAALVLEYVTSVRVSGGHLVVVAPLLDPRIRCRLWFRTIVYDTVG